MTMVDDVKINLRKHEYFFPMDNYIACQDLLLPLQLCSRDLSRWINPTAKVKHYQSLD